MDRIVNKAFDQSELVLVFGEDSRGESPEDRAATSTRIFVRSQIQLAFYNERAKGRRFIATEALDIFGWDTLLTVAREGSATLVQNCDEPANTILQSRSRLNIEKAQLARQVGLPVKAIETAETSGALSSIRDLEKICHALSIDERVIGMVKNGRVDRDLAVRLRMLSEERDEVNFSPSSVLVLSEASWVIARQVDLQNKLRKTIPESGEFEFRKDYNYSHPAWKQGFRLAAATRQILGLSPDKPINKLRHLVETRLEIPMIQQKLSTRFAGATLATGNIRGIVVNEDGANSSVWTRRMTICHELGHLLWDPEQKLNRLKVDTYEGLNRFEFKKIKDPVEERANAFAVAFLAPPEAVKNIVSKSQTLTHAVAKLMHDYGISSSAAKRHITNITRLETDEVQTWRIPPPSDDWIGRENFTMDWFPDRNTPLSRRGKFAWIVSLSLQRRKISADTASMLLCIPIDQVEDKCGQVLEAFM